MGGGEHKDKVWIVENREERPLSLKKNGTINKWETEEEKGAGRSEQTYRNPHSAPALGLFILQIELSTSPL